MEIGGLKLTIEAGFIRFGTDGWELVEVQFIGLWVADTCLIIWNILKNR